MNAVESALTEAQIQQFKKEGHLIFRQMASPETCRQMNAVVSEHLHKTVAPLEYETQVGYPGAPSSFNAPGGQTIRRLQGAYHRHACFAQWAARSDLIAKLALLLGEDICLSLAHHNSIMTKHPDFGTATAWHRDIRYWSFTRPDLISVWLALGNENAGNGGLQIIPGSHRLSIEKERLDELDFLKLDHPANLPLVEQGIAPELQQGDVMFFHSGLFHAAGRNNSSAVKTSLVFAYHGQSNHPLPGTRSSEAGSIALEA
jgi:phytanoyl-CoA hydroxylase